jgi:hypothetical protein
MNADERRWEQDKSAFICVHLRLNTEVAAQAGLGSSVVELLFFCMVKAATLLTVS